MREQFEQIGQVFEILKKGVLTRQDRIELSKYDQVIIDMAMKWYQLWEVMNLDSEPTYEEAFGGQV